MYTSKTILALVSILTIVTPVDALSKKDLEFVVVIPSYNNEKWARRNLESIVNQKTESKFSIICVNDRSTDGTGAIMDEFAQKHASKPGFLKVIHNPTRKGATYNIYTTIHEHCKDHQIVVLVDGDDALSTLSILDRLAQEYTNPHLWMTYGQFIFYPSGQWGVCYEITREDLLQKRVRSLPYVSQHLRTFKAGLFKKIRREDLMVHGEYMAMNVDMATMIPMMEMCAPKDAKAPQHCKFIPDIMYIYNYENPISDFRVDRQLQLDLEKVIRAIPPYEPLEAL